jgi:predicted TIM-barrel fold metal-dependent hydrolase
MPSVARSYRLIDSDSHVNEPPDLWQSRVPAAYRDRAPRMEHFEEGDAWVLEGVPDPITFGLNACAGLPPGQMRQWMRWEDIRRGGWDPAARLAEMDTDGVDAQILYPTPRLSHSIIANQDTEFHLALVRAYNDWLGEYCSHAPHRLGGLVMVPNRGIDTAVAEFERAIQLPGMVGALVTCYPHGDLDIEPADDALWRAVAESGYPLHIHV